MRTEPEWAESVGGVPVAGRFPDLSRSHQNVAILGPPDQRAAVTAHHGLVPLVRTPEWSKTVTIPSKCGHFGHPDERAAVTAHHGLVVPGLGNSYNPRGFEGNESSNGSIESRDRKYKNWNYESIDISFESSR